MRFDTFVVVDWSGASKPSPVGESKDAIWIGIAREQGVEASYHRTRAAATETLAQLFEAERAAGRRVLAGFDFPFAYPKGFAEALTGRSDPFAIWEALAQRIEDAPDNANNRLEVAAEINRLFPGSGPFWGNGMARDIQDLPRTKQGYANPFAETRTCDETPGAQPVWKLAGARIRRLAGAVGHCAAAGPARAVRQGHRRAPLRAAGRAPRAGRTFPLADQRHGRRAGRAQ